LRLCLRLCG